MEPVSGSGQFAGKVAVITGAGRGIGREEVRLFVSQGAKVLVNDLGGGSTGGGGDAHIAQAVVDEIVAAGGEAVAETSSVDSFEGGRRVIEAAMDAFGRVDFVINNAGIARNGRIDEMTEEDLQRVLAVNLIGYAGTMRAAAPHFIRQGGGVVVNSSSPSGFGHYANTAYSAAKEGVVGLTRSAARDLGQYGVRCNALRPIANGSNMATPEMYESLATSMKLGIPPLWNLWPGANPFVSGPGHVAAVAAWLCTDAAQAANGREFYINGQELGLVAEPHLQRTLFAADGWTLEALSQPHVAMNLLGGVRNGFAGT